MNNWIYHLKDFAKENNITYADAVKNPECRKQYYDNLGKTPPKKVKKIMKVEKINEEVEPMKPIAEKVRKVKSKIEAELKKVKTVRPKLMIKKNVEPI
jgi:hypothetical protein